MPIEAVPIEDGASLEQRIHGFPPVASPDARALILGSMPGEASLRAGRYYAHPRNQFWPIIGKILGIATDAGYEERLQSLQASGIALWDVLGSCARPGSLDADIVTESLQVNDFASFLDAHARIERVLFNGAMSEVCFRRHAAPALEGRDVRLIRLPSTSPANASAAYAFKLAAWREALDITR